MAEFHRDCRRHRTRKQWHRLFWRHLWLCLNHNRNHEARFPEELRAIFVQVGALREWMVIVMEADDVVIPNLGGVTFPTERQALWAAVTANDMLGYFASDDETQEVFRRTDPVWRAAWRHNRILQLVGLTR